MPPHQIGGRGGSGGLWGLGVARGREGAPPELVLFKKSPNAMMFMFVAVCFQETSHHEHWFFRCVLISENLGAIDVESTLGLFTDMC